MSDLMKLSVTQLRQRCVAAGISTTGLRKAELIASLAEVEELEENSAELAINSAKDVGTDNNKNDSTGDVEDEEINEQEDADGAVRISDPPEIMALKLKLQIAKVELQTLREKQAAANADHASAPAANAISSVEAHVRGALPKMGADEENVIAFFSAFERCLELYDVDKSVYCRLLPGCLSPKAFKVYSSLNKQQALDYELTKKQILASFKLDALSYLTKFRSARRTGSESYTLFANRMQDLLHYYLDAKGINTFESLKSDLLLTTFVDSLPIAVKTVVLSKRVKDIFEAADQADLAFQIEQERYRANPQRNAYSSAKENSQAMRSNVTRTGISVIQTETGKTRLSEDQTVITCFNCGKPGHKRSACSEAGNILKTGKGNLKVSMCFSCGERGHKTGSPMCKKSPITRNNQLLAQINKNDSRHAFVIPCFINGHETKALRDTGADVVLLCEETFKDIVTPLPGKFMQISGITGMSIQIPIAEVNIFSPHFKQDGEVKVTAGLVKNASFHEKVIIGNSLFQLHPQLTDILTVRREADEPVGVQQINRVITRSRSRAEINRSRGDRGQPSLEGERSLQSIKRDKSAALSRSRRIKLHDEATAVAQPESAACTRPSNSNDRVFGKVIGANSELKENDNPNVPTTNALNNSIDTELDPSEHKSLELNGAETRTVKAADNKSLLPIDQLESSNPTSTACDGRSNFMSKQQADEQLKKLFTLAETNHPQYTVENDLLYRRDICDGGRDGRKLLIVPASLRQQVLGMAHDTMFSGAHNGAYRMTQRIKSAGLWFDKMFPFCKQWQRSCPECQKLAVIRKGHRVPMTEIPIVNEVFSELSVDVCGGDWPITPRRNKYLMTVQCTASRYGWAIPVTNLKAKTLAAKLMHLFASIGLPKVLKLDSAAQWRGSLISELTGMLGITCNIATAFHHESIGGIERLNQSIERMAKSYISDNPTAWDIFIDYFMFAYNSAPNATLGVSPQTLVFGRNLRSPLDVLTEIWTTGEPERPKLGKDVLTYLADLRSQLAAASEAAEAEANYQAKRQKAIYDKKSRKRELKVGDKVLVLQPTSTFKLFAKWEGPWLVTKKLNAVNYEIDMGRRKTVLHINLLRKWEERSEPVNLVILDDGIQEEEKTFWEKMEDSNDATNFNIGSQLEPHQALELKKLLAEFSDVFTEKLGRTDLIEHEIKIKDQRPCVSAPYKVPEALQAQVEQEIERLLAEGILIESDSPYAAPLVVIKKPNGKLRLCGNYSLVNSLCEDDVYMMNNPANIIRRAARCKYLSKIDLSQAFYQIPLSKESRKYTAIRTFCGHFEYTVGSFGLKNMPKTFQRLANKILRGAQGYACSHLDDYVVWSNTFEEHIIHLRDVLQRLRNAHLTASKAKSDFILPRMKILGNIIENSEIKPDPDKISAIERIDTLKTKKDVKCFLGLTGYYAEYIPAYQDKAYPLTELLRRNKPEKVQWGESEQKALEALKRALTAKPVLHPPDPSMGYILQTDASRVSISAILAQRDAAGRERVIAYASKKLLPREQLYSVIELETYAVIFGLTKFDHYLFGRKIELQSDHKPLSYMATWMNNSPRLARWNLILSKYDIKATYKKASLNTNADGLSRL